MSVLIGALVTIFTIETYYTLLQISVSLCKDQPNTPLLDLMRRTGVLEVQRVLGEYVHQLKSGLLPTVHQDQPIRVEYDDPCVF